VPGSVAEDRLAAWWTVACVVAQDEWMLPGQGPWSSDDLLVIFLNSVGFPYTIYVPPRTHSSSPTVSIFPTLLAPFVLSSVNPSLRGRRLRVISGPSAFGRANHHQTKREQVCAAANNINTGHRSPNTATSAPSSPSKPTPTRLPP
jgi:hypothetical protein